MLSAIRDFWNNRQRRKHLRDLDTYRNLYTNAPERVKQLLVAPPSEDEANSLPLEKLVAFDREIIDGAELELLLKELQRKDLEDKNGTTASFKVVTGPNNLLYLDMSCTRSNANVPERRVIMYADLFNMHGMLDEEDTIAVKFMASRTCFKPGTHYVKPGYLGSLDMLDKENLYFMNYIQSTFGDKGIRDAVALMHESVRRNRKRRKRDNIVSRLIGECVVTGIFPDPRSGAASN